MIQHRIRAAALGLLATGVACVAIGMALASAPDTTTLRFEVTVAPGLLAKPTDGRLLVVLGSAGGGGGRRGGGGEPRNGIGGNVSLTHAPLLGADIKGLAAGVVGVADGGSEIYPIESLAKLPAGQYNVQAVFDWNPDLRLPNAPGNLYSEPQMVAIDPAKGGTHKLTLTKQLPAEQLPADTATSKYIKLESKLMSQFFGRPMFVRPRVDLPSGFETEPNQKYPLLVRIGGYGTRFTQGGGRGGRGGDGPKFLTLQLDGAGPFGDPYQVNSANNGPLGDAVTQELIPYVEQKYRGIGQGYARFTTGHSTGGWVSFALQVFYPDFFNGCWSSAPDSVDFRSYELINIYQDNNAYVNSFGFERPSKRTVLGDTVYTVRHETQIENVLGRGDRWWLSGKDWCAWNATYGPRGEDGLPKPLWHPKTGAIDRSVVEHWKKYDLRMVLQDNWKDLAPRLKGKIHIYVGDGDDYFLNNAVRRLAEATRQFSPPFDGEIVFGAAQGHGFHPVSDADMLRAMAARAEKK